MADRKQVSREEDFRDYEERDARDGWPYPDDDDARRAAQNAPYGTAASLYLWAIAGGAIPELTDPYVGK